MGDHGGSAVDVAKGLPQQHCQFAVPAGCIHIAVSKQHSNISQMTMKAADTVPGGAILNAPS